MNLDIKAAPGQVARVANSRTRSPMVWEKATVVNVTATIGADNVPKVKYRVRLHRLADNTGRIIYLNVTDKQLKLLTV